jgi:hypothetical protein
LYKHFQADKNFVTASEDGTINFFQIPPFECTKSEKINSKIKGLTYIQGKLILFTEKPNEYNGLSNVQETSLIVVIDNQPPLTLSLSDGKVCKAIEVANILIIYGGNTVFFIQVINDNGKYSLILNMQQSLALDRDYSMNSLVYYPSKSIFIGGHESGELSAWNPCEKGLANIASTKIGTSVSVLSISLFFNL